MVEPVKRGRGRPPKVDANGERIVVVKTSTGQKRGRPSSKGTSEAKPKAVKAAPKEDGVAAEDETDETTDVAVKGKGRGKA
mmetsp:Transcript_13768/g.13310  ORF Transcript_13768/g.13310 Transcript_13768/m.13310 type:complete len:81 (+) Transcript_13768:17-259(+)|eukprot:CAMPEP_0119038876 /NCGR_PEP_ID=MMETSP1177-20130426/8044_1 /TAXON_ID=2985 /ORGANISM="Ochromonas sp, Strain CCMP1899" /LENGTH=80 /DNA_ID=CAMNT_0007002005 /DNA_START=15 /DNA_END=257 /DNA_ORIENTATION=-